MDINKLRKTGLIIRSIGGLTQEGEIILQAADRLDELEARLKEYDGARVLVVDSDHNCVMQYAGKCPLNDKWCTADYRKNECPLRRGVVVVKMKKE